MPPPRNIQLFNHMGADLLVQLYDAFPSGITVDPRDLGMRTANAADSDEEETKRILGGMANDTINFLERSGLIEIGIDARGLTGGELLDVKLTRAGLEVLGAVPELLRERDNRTFIERLRESLTQRSPELAADALGLLLKAFGAG